MKNGVLLTLIVAVAIIVSATIATAQESQVIHFQGLLTGPDGGPLITDIYDVNFSIWDHATNGFEPLWSEIQVVEVTDGLFDVFLGSQIPLSADVFTHAEEESDLRYLQIQVEGDDPMTPRIQIAKTPNSFVSSRVLGDVHTGPGSLKMMDPADDKVGFDVFTGGEGNSIKLMEPADDVVPLVELSARDTESSIKLIDPGDDKVGFEVFTGGEGNSIKLMDPADDGVPVAEIAADATQSSFKLMDPVDDKVGFDVFTGGEGNSLKLMDPVDDGIVGLEMTADDVSNGMVIFWTEPIDNEAIPVISMDADGLNNSINFRMAHPPEGPNVIPSIEMTADAGATSFKMMDPGDDEIGFDVFIGGEGNSIKMMDPGDDENSLIEMNGGIGGDASILMFNPQPEPPAVIMEMSSSPSTGGSFRMFNPQPEPPADPLLEMNTTQYGANFAMAAPGAGGLRNEITDPMFEVNVDTSGSSLKMMDPADPEIVGLDMVVDSSGPKFRAWFPQIPGQIPGVEIMTSSTDPGGNQASFKMFNPQPEPPAVVTSMVSSVEGASFTMYAPIFDGQGDVMFDVFIDAQGANLSLSDEIGKYMGFEPTPFYDGGLLRMFDPVTDITMVSLGSDGSIQAKKGTIGNSSNDGNYNFVMGTGNQANGDYNFVGGFQAQSDFNNCFLWADYSMEGLLTTSTNNQFLVRSTGGVKFFTDGQMVSGVELTPGSSMWSSLSDKNSKRNVRPVNGTEILNKIDQLPIGRWSYKAQDENIEHIGPMAQDFYALFGIGEDDRHISMLDPSGVALAGVKELISRIEELEARIAELEAER